MTGPRVYFRPIQPKKRDGCMTGCLAFLLAVLVLIAGCGTTFLLGRNYVREYRETAIPPDDISHLWKEVNVYDQIHLAYLAGEIDRQTEVLLLLQAVYLPETLPEEYAKPKPGDIIKTLSRELQWLVNNYDRLDPDTQQMVRPFVLSPGNPGSYFHPGFNRNKNKSRALSLVNIAFASPGEDQDNELEHWPEDRDETEWAKKSIDIQGAPAIKVYCVDSNLLAPQLRDIEEALKKAWPMFRDLLGNQPEQELKIYLTDRLAYDGDAIYPDGDLIPTYEIRLDDSLAGDYLKAVTVHELFHIFQFSLGLTWADADNDLGWLLEATAVWAEHYVYPGPPHSEHEYLEEFFDTLHQDRLSVLGLQEYASYMFFFFLSDHRDRTHYVPDILHQAVSSEDIRGILMTVNDLSNKYGRFALCSWNYDPPWFCYSDDIEPRLPGGESRRSFSVEAPGKRHYPDLLQPGGIIYRVFSITAPPDEIRKVTFYLQPTGLDQDIPDCLCEASPVWDWVGDPLESEWLKKQALIKIGNNWLSEPEDWTELEYREFDRTHADENVTQIIMIISNADMRDSLDHEYVVVAEGKPALTPLAAVGPALGYRFPGSESWMMAQPDAQDYRWNIPGEEVLPPIFEMVPGGPHTTMLYLPDAQHPLVAGSPRCWWPIIGKGFFQGFHYASRGLTATDNQHVDASGSYNLVLTVRCPGDYSDSEVYNYAVQQAKSYIPPALYNLIKRHIVDSVLDDQAVRYRWRLKTTAVAPIPEDQQRMESTEVYAYGFTPGGDQMVLQIDRDPEQPASEIDVEIAWKYNGQGHSSTGNYGMVAVEGSYEIFDSCQGPPVKTGALFAESSTSSIADSGRLVVTLPENARYLQVVVHVEAESFATNRIEVVEADLECEIAIRIAD